MANISLVLSVIASLITPAMYTLVFYSTVNVKDRLNLYMASAPFADAIQGVLCLLLWLISIKKMEKQWSMVEGKDLENETSES